MNFDHALERFRNWCRPNPDFLRSYGGAIELHAAFREEIRTSSLSARAARRKSGEATSSFAFSRRAGSPLLATFMRPLELRNQDEGLMEKEIAEPEESRGEPN